MVLKSGVACGSNRTSTAACFLHAIWDGHITSKGIVDDEDGVSTSSVGGKSEVHVVLVQGIDKRGV